jgi:hypothetical protein
MQETGRRQCRINNFGICQFLSQLGLQHHYIVQLIFVLYTVLGITNVAVSTIMEI